MRWAIVGLGTHAARVATALQDTPSATLVGVVSRTKAHAHAFAEAYPNVHAATSLADLRAHVAPEAVFICSPNHRHGEESIEALQQGLPVLCEKPMALTAVEAARVAEAATQAGQLFGVGFHLRFHPLVQQAHTWMREGRLGTLQAVESHWSVGRLHEAALPPLADAHKEWREVMAQSGGGASQARGIHLFDLIRHLTGARITHATALHQPADPDRPDLTALTLLRGAPAWLASVATSRLIPAARNHLTLYGSEGMLTLRDAFQPDGTGTLQFENGQQAPEVHRLETTRNLYAEEISAFSAALRGERAWAGATAQDGVVAAALMDAEWRSVRSGRAESVDETLYS